MSRLLWRLKALWTRCECCGGFNATRYHQRTSYVEEECNYVTLCPPCMVENDRYWDEMWAEYYRGVL